MRQRPTTFRHDVIRERMERLNMSVPQLTSELRLRSGRMISVRTVGGWVRKCEPRSFEDLYLLAQALNLKLADLFVWVDQVD